jgi:predicted phage terminase large subunit-like protein
MMSVDEQIELLEGLAELGRRSLLSFVKYVFQGTGGYKAGWFHEKLANQLDQFLEDSILGKSPRLIIQAPPRHGKTELASRAFPAYALGRYPDLPIIATSYSSDLASDNNRDVQRIIDSADYHYLFPETTISGSPFAQRSTRAYACNLDKFEIINHQGEYKSAGVGSGITGKGGQILLIDDPIKDSEEANSKTIRESIWEWYLKTFYTRAEPGAGICIIMCMAGDTPVTMADGTRKYLRDIKKGDLILTYKEGKQVIRAVLNHMSQGEDDVFEIRTGNHIVKANKKHPFLTKDGWVRLEDLKKGNRLICSGQENHKTKALISEKEAWLLGFMYGDGWITINKKKNKHKATGKVYSAQSFITCVALKKSSLKNDKIEKTFYDVFGIKLKKTRFGYYRTEVANVGRWFLERGIVGGAKGKRFPPWIFGQSLCLRIAFLEGVIDSDGHVNKRDRVALNLANKGLCEDIRNLVRSCGMSPTNLSESTAIRQPPHSPKPILSYSCNIQFQKTIDISEFKTATIRSITFKGREEVFDLQIEDTECFLADGLVSHNTRWHNDDLVGKLLENMRAGGEWWAEFKFPAIATRDEEHRAKGEALHPERYSLEMLERIKIGTSEKIGCGSRAFEALYQQNPVAAEGDILKRDFWRWTVPPTPLEEMSQQDRKTYLRDLGISMILQAWDTALGEKKLNDFSACATLGIAQNRYYLLEIWKGRIEFPDLLDVIQLRYDKWKPQKVIVEGGGSHGGKAAYQTLKRQTRLPIFEKPTTSNDKVFRAQALAPHLEAGRVYMFTGSPWAGDFVDQCADFPNLKNDDDVDSFMIALETAIGGPKKLVVTTQMLEMAARG